jgi:hypothetical protein
MASSAIVFQKSEDRAIHVDQNNGSEFCLCPLSGLYQTHCEGQGLHLSLGMLYRRRELF